MLLAVACALPAPLVASAAAAPQDAVFGEWGTQGMSAKVTVAPCSARSDLVCGTISWLWEPVDASGRPKTDAENPSPDLRGRPLIGAQILSGFRREPSGALDGGTIYNPEDGRTYGATLRLQGADTLAVEGCVLFICRKQIWRRASAVCGARP
jgi:uncharacterized protein (DUF2147 family)